MSQPSSSSPLSPNPTQTIDLLLEHYLSLLDEYTALRNTLHVLQANIFQNLARANFSADRGIRYYGQDYYDERMQASRRVTISTCSKGEAEVDGGEGGKAEGERKGYVTTSGPVFTVGLHQSPSPEQDGKQKPESEPWVDDSGATRPLGEAERPVCKPDPAEDASANNTDEKDQPSAGDKQQKPERNDPLRWFGILTPLPLRQAQGQAINAVEEIIPRLATLSAEMAGIELEVRRARKKRAKAEKAEEKKTMSAGTGLDDKTAQVDVTA
ncbi:hypothetical protein VTI74DRAFT_4355 [Chaetomium olivicolor]